MVPYHDAVTSPENDGLAWQRGLSSTPSVSTICNSYSRLVYCCSISLLLTTICCALHVFFFALNAAVRYPRVLRFVLEHDSGYGSGYGWVTVRVTVRVALVSFPTAARLYHMHLERIISADHHAFLFSSSLPPFLISSHLVFSHRVNMHATRQRQDEMTCDNKHVI